MSKPKIDWSKNPHAGLDNDATWLKCENSTLRAKIKELEAEVARLRKIAAHVPAKEYIKAKEAAGFGAVVKALGEGKCEKS